MKHLLTLLAAIVCLKVSAQHPNQKVWAFGIYAGLDFSTQPPTGITTSIIGWESYGTQCDEQGNLLFYTNGEKIYDKQNNLMPHGDSLMGNIYGSTSQGVQILPDPTNTNQYILLSLDPDESYSQYPFTNGRLYYSIVDMSLNNGLGDVVTGQKNIVIDSSFSEHMMIVSNECKMWLVTHTVRDAWFRCYEINGQGINMNPVVSYSGTSWNISHYIRGEVAYDPVGKHIFLSTPDSTYSRGILEMHDFDMNTGMVSNGHALDSNSIFYRICVSPKGSKLYATGTMGGTVYLVQYDLSLPAPDIINSQAVIFNSGNDFLQDMAIGIDSMIYGTPNSSATFLCRIEQPEVQGLGCNFVYNAVPLATGTYSVGGLPSPSIKRYTAGTQEFYYHDATICNGTLILMAPDNTYDSYVWSDGNIGLSTTVTQPGIYWVTAIGNCTKRVDTFNVTDFVFEPHVHDTSICFTSSAILTAPVNLPGYLWSDGSTGSQITVTQPGVYWVYATDFCIETVDTFKVSFIDYTVHLPNDTIVCDDAIISPVVNIDGVTYLWQNGSSTNSYTATSSGTYWVEVNKNDCKKADTMHIDNKSIHVALGNDTLLCEHILLTLKVDNTDATYVWQDGSTENKYIVNTAGTYSVRADNNICSTNDTINVSYEKCDCFFNVPSVFTPNMDGKNDLLKPIIETSCPVTEYTFYIYNRWGECVYTTTTSTDRWDGRYKGQLADVGTYMYMLSFKGAKGKTFTQKGDVTLLR